MKLKPLMTAVALVAVGVVLGVVIVSDFSGAGAANAADTKSQLGAASPPVRLSTQVETLNDAFVAVSEAVNPQVVSISVMGNDEGRNFFGRSTPREAAGSGVIISNDGYIVTNNHVVEDAAENGIRVITNSREEFDAQLIGTDKLTDLAVLKINVTNMSHAYFGGSEDVNVGQWVVAVGNPLGLRSTITAGIVSAIGRGQLGLNQDAYAVENFIQTDAAINPGNSGGGLFDLEGKLIGINTAIASRTGYYSGYGFAIPSDLVRSVVDDLIEDGKINRGYIGVRIGTIDAADAKAFGLSRVQGVKVIEVMPNSAGEEGGLKEFDVILEVDGHEVATSQDLQSIVAQHRAGDRVELTIWRDDQTLTKHVRLKSRDDESETFADAIPGEQNDKDDFEPIEFENLGITVAPLTDEVRDELDIDYGVVVTAVNPRSAVARSRKIVQGDVITKADRSKINSPNDLKDIVERKEAGDAILLQLNNRGNTRIEGVEIPDTEW